MTELVEEMELFGVNKLGELDRHLELHWAQYEPEELARLTQAIEDFACEFGPGWEEATLQDLEEWLSK